MKRKKIFIVALLLLLFTAGFISAARQKMVIQASRCVGCEDCRSICPKDAIKMVRKKAVIDPDKCIGCKQCIYICSYGAIK